MLPASARFALLAALGGYLVPWALPEGLARVEGAPGQVADVFLFAGRLDAGGAPELTPIKGDWKEIAGRARGTGARVWLTMVNDRVPAAGTAVLKDADAVGTMLADPERRRAHRGAIVALARSLDAQGVDLDYENLPAAERDRFTTFVRELAADLRQAGLLFSVTVQPKSGESSSRGPGAADWPAICRAADRVQPMLYNEHNASTGPGPVASPAFVAKVLRYAASACPMERLAPVLKVSGMDWGPGAATWVTFDEAAARAAKERARLRRDRKSKVPWLAYDGKDGRHVVWYEDARSLGEKADALREAGAADVVLWSLGAEDPESLRRLAGQKR